MLWICEHVLQFSNFVFPVFRLFPTEGGTAFNKEYTSTLNYLGGRGANGVDVYLILAIVEGTKGHHKVGLLHEQHNQQ